MTKMIQKNCLLAAFIALNTFALVGCGTERKGSKDSDENQAPQSIVVRIDQNTGKAERVFLDQGKESVPTNDSERQTYLENLSGWEPIKEEDVIPPSDVDANVKEVPENSIKFVYDPKAPQKKSKPSSRGGNSMAIASGRGCYPSYGNSSCNNYWNIQYPYVTGYTGFPQPYYPSFGYYHYPLGNNIYQNYFYSPTYFFWPTYYTNYSYFNYQPFGLWTLGSFLYLWFFW